MFIVRKSAPKILIPSEHIKNECINSDLLAQFQTRDNKISVFCCQNENDIFRLMGAMAATLGDGFKNHKNLGTALRIKATIPAFCKSIEKYGITVEKNPGETIDRYVNDNHYDIVINNISQIKNFYKYLYIENNIEHHTIGLAHIVHTYKYLYDQQSEDIEWDRLDKSNKKILES